MQLKGSATTTEGLEWVDCANRGDDEAEEAEDMGLAILLDTGGALMGAAAMPCGVPALLSPSDTWS